MLKINIRKIKQIKSSQKLIQYLSEMPLLSFLLKLFQRIVLPGFDGLSIYDVAVFFFKGLVKGSINIRAASLSYKFYISIFPTIIFLFSIIPYVPINGFQDNLLNLLKNLFPPSIYDLVHDTIFDIIMRQRGGLLSLGFIFALYFATNGINGIIEAFNETYHSIETRSFFKQKLISVFLVFVLTFVVIIAISLIIGSTALFNYLESINIIKDSFAYYMILLGKWIIIILMLFFGVSSLYYFGPAKKERYRFISAGATLATFLFILASIAFNYYIANFSKYNTLYGSIGTLIIILIWINFNATILLIGFELNASINKAKKLKNNN